METSKNKRWWSKGRELAPKLGRAAGVLLVVYGITALVSYRSARADMNAQMRDLGRRLSRYSGEQEQREGRTLRINGQPLYFAGAHLDQDVDTVLDSFERACNRGGMSMGELTTGLMDGRLPSVGETEPRDTTLRDGNADDGYVACFDPGTDRPSRESMLSRLRSAVAGGDFSRIGNFRYVYAQKDRNDTRVTAVWTQGAFELKQMFPAHGDAPGQDVRNVPRPPAARRILTAFGDDAPSAMTVYVGSSMDARALDAHYRRALTARGFQIDTRRHDVGGFMAHAGPRILVMVFDDTREGGAATILDSLSR